MLEARSSAAREAGAFDATPEIVYTGGWHLHDGFIEATADRIDVARATLSPTVRDRARIIFTAHSIPTSMAHAETYQRELRESAAAVAARLKTEDWTLVYQSRSGRPQDPWLEPDVNDYLRAARRRRHRGDPVADRLRLRSHRGALRSRYRSEGDVRRTQARDGARRRGQRSPALHRCACRRGRDDGRSVCEGRPLPIVSADTPNAVELPPPVASTSEEPLSPTPSQGGVKFFIGARRRAFNRTSGGQKAHLFSRVLGPAIPLRSRSATAPRRRETRRRNGSSFDAGENELLGTQDKPRGRGLARGFLFRGVTRKRAGAVLVERGGQRARDAFALLLRSAAPA